MATNVSALFALYHCDDNIQRSQQLAVPFLGGQSLNESQHSARSRTRFECPRYNSIFSLLRSI